MSSKVYDLTSYSFVTGEEILIDTNIWLYLFPAPKNPQPRFTTSYATAFKKLISAKAQPVLDPIVLSEYLNRYCQIEWKGGYISRYSNFKDFRKSSDFRAVVSSAQTFASKILNSCKTHSIPANELGLSNAVKIFMSGKVDFNDALLINICKKRSLKLMTNDSDFQSEDIDILTTNPKLLKAYK